MLNTDFYKNLVIDGIKPYVSNTFVLLAVPHHFNAGDSFIWESEVEMFEEMGCVRRFSSSIQDYKYINIRPEDTIIFNGGGSYGDIWESYTNFIENVSREHPYNTIIIMPQSVCFNSELRLKENIEKMKKHKGDIVFCCRDENSYKFMCDNFSFFRNKLLPDMALCWDIDKYIKKRGLKLCDVGDKKLYLHRHDKELKTTLNVEISSTCDICDWNKINCKEISLCKDKTKINEIWAKFGRYSVIDNAIMLFSKYEIIYTDRLHAAILGLLMGKTVYLIDNIYGKSSSLVNTWLNNEDNIKIIQNE